MHYQVLTIFPELFTSFSERGLVGKAVQSGRIRLDAIQLRDFAVNTQGQLDDTPFGGGSGMVLRPEPAAAAIEQARSRAPNAKVVLFTPRGRVLDRALVRQIADTGAPDGLILLCCRYEGVDERVAEKLVDYQISLGDYVLMGGEVAAMAFIEATSRFIPGVLGNPESAAEESFEEPLLEYPQYTKPREALGEVVPEVLLSGHHRQISQWRRAQAVEDTRTRRPDLYAHYLVERRQRGERVGPPGDLSVALIHHPVLGKDGSIITSSITNLDLHDIARSSRSYGIENYYIVHPTKAMRRLMGKIMEHWSEGFGLQYNPNRSDALKTVTLFPDVDDVLADIEARTGVLPKIIVTSAKPGEGRVSFGELRATLWRDDRPHLILLGTGWGLADVLADRADYYLEPIQGFSDYNHLSVRAAAAIIFDRLLGFPVF